MKWKSSYTFAVLLLLFFVSLFFTEDVYTIPKWPLFVVILLLTYVFAILLQDAFRIKGQGIIADLPIESGGHSSFNPQDIRLAVPDNDESEKFTVFATGGFSALGFEFKGNEAFCVCPPEHFHYDMTPGAICVTKFHRIDYDDLPDYVQSELLKLHKFSVERVSTHENLWFGMTSKEDGTDNAENHNIERKFVAANQETNYLKELIKEMQAQERERRRKRIVKYPESYFSKKEKDE